MGYPDASRDNVFDRARDNGVEPVGAVLGLAGAVLVLAAFTVLPWFRGTTGFFAGAQAHSTFADVRTLLQSVQRQVQADGTSSHVTFGASLPYFTWLGWALFAAAAVTCGLAVSRLGGARWSWRWLAMVAAAAGIGLTFQAVDLFVVEGTPPRNATPPGYGDFLAHTNLGMWAATAGFLLFLCASAVRTSSRRPAGGAEQV